MEKCQENERLIDDLKVAVEFSKKSQEASFSQLSKLKSEIEELKKKLACLETEKHIVSASVQLRFICNFILFSSVNRFMYYLSSVHYRMGGDNTTMYFLVTFTIFQ